MIAFPSADPPPHTHDAFTSLSDGQDTARHAVADRIRRKTFAARKKRSQLASPQPWKVRSSCRHDICQSGRPSLVFVPLICPDLMHKEVHAEVMPAERDQDGQVIPNPYLSLRVRMSRL